MEVILKHNCDVHQDSQKFAQRLSKLTYGTRNIILSKLTHISTVYRLCSWCKTNEQEARSLPQGVAGLVVAEFSGGERHRNHLARLSHTVAAASMHHMSGKLLKPVGDRREEGRRVLKSLLCECLLLLIELFVCSNIQDTNDNEKTPLNIQVKSL